MNANPIGRPVAGGSQVLPYTGTQGVSKPVQSGINCVRLIASTDCYVAIGPGAGDQAGAADMLIKANAMPEYFACSPGDIITAVQVAAGGNLNITPIMRAAN